MTTTNATSGTALLSRYEYDKLVYQDDRYIAGGDQPGESCYFPHLAWFCRGCGEIWRREIFSYNFTYSPRIADPWQVMHQYCTQCGEAEIRRLFAELLKEYE